MNYCVQLKFVVIHKQNVSYKDDARNKLYERMNNLQCYIIIVNQYEIS